MAVAVSGRGPAYPIASGVLLVIGALMLAYAFRNPLPISPPSDPAPIVVNYPVATRIVIVTATATPKPPYVPHVYATRPTPSPVAVARDPSFAGSDVGDQRGGYTP